MANQTAKSGKQFIFLLLGALLAAIVLLYWRSIPKLLLFWDKPDYSHAYIIPPLLAWIFWTERKHLAATADNSYKFAWFFLACTTVLFALGSFSAILALVFLSIWALLLALLGLFYGDRGLKTLWPLAITAFFAVPWPAFIFNNASFKLRLLSSWLSELMLRAISIPVYREGNVIDLGSIQLEVVDACSGLRYLLPSLLMAVLAGWLFLKRPLMRVWLVFFAVPVAVFSNAFRIMITGVLCRWFGPAMAEGFFHDFSGWLVYVISLVVLLGLLYILRRLEQRKPDKIPAPLPEKDFRAMDKLPGKKNLLIVLAVLLALIAVNTWASHPAPTLERMDMAKFPLRLGDWQAKVIDLEADTIKGLGTDQVFNASYINLQTGDLLYFLITYYPEQDSSASAHAPASCMLGSGWSIMQKKEVAGSETPHDTPTGRILLKKQNIYIVSNFWFQQRGRLISNEFLNKLYLFMDAMRTRRTDGGLVRIELVLRPGMTPEEGQEIINGFIALIKPEVPKFIPN